VTPVPDAGRVVGGTARGLRLDAAGPATRPLTDRVKESLFGALESAGALDGPFLDLFAGSGAGGIEALSRGAPSATFVERDGRTCEVIGSNLRRARLDGGHVVRSDVVSFLQRRRRDDDPAYLAVLLDPPYGEPVLERALELLADRDAGWLAPAATVVAKHFWRDDLPEHIGALTRTRHRRFGETAVTFYTRPLETA
jgi:16S rRNA (guanine966-N2)-methyltransferase